MVLRGVLKFLSGAVIVAAVILTVLAAGGYFAAKSFDPNFFKTELEKQLAAQTGMRVELGNIKLQWKGGPSVRLDGLKFYNPVNLEKLVQGDSVVIEADLASLWQKKIRVPRVLIQNPELFLKRRSNGSWNWQAAEDAVQIQAGPPGPAQTSRDPAAGSPIVETGARTASGGSSDSKVPAAIPLAFGLDKIEVRDGTVHYFDETVQPAYTLQIVNCEAEIVPRAGMTVFRLVLKGAVWQSSAKPVRLTGDLDLGARVLDFKFVYDGGRAALDGSLKLIENLPHFDGTLKLRALDLESLVPEANRGGEYLAGALSGDLRLSFDGGNPEVLRRSLDAAGKVGIVDGALKNRNVIREVVQRMSPVVAVAGLLGDDSSPQVVELTKGPDTGFRQASADFSASRGSVDIRDFSFERPECLLMGKGIYGLLNDQIDLTASLRFSRDISGHFVKKARELEMLCDRNGSLIIPFRYAGTVPAAAAVTPDLHYIGGLIAREGAEQAPDKTFENSQRESNQTKR